MPILPVERPGLREDAPDTGHPGGSTIAVPNPLAVPPSDVERLQTGQAGFDVQAWAAAPISYTVRVDQGLIIPSDPYGPYYGNP